MSQHTADDQKNSVQYTSSSAATTPRQSLPLTPPTYPDLVLKTRHSPSSSISSTSQYGCVPNPATYCFTARSTTNLGLNSEREGVPNAESRRVSMPLTQPQYGLPNLYVMAPAPQNMNNYYPTIVGNPHISDGVNHQQPLLNVGLPLLDARYASLLIMLQFTSPSINPWQHHHYIAPSSSCFPFPQDRYICPTCTKVFSRPSSLKIHSRTHTGEKPFRCPVKGCGKKFSVVSNMKRHERSCHGGGICREGHY